MTVSDVFSQNKRYHKSFTPHCQTYIAITASNLENSLLADLLGGNCAESASHLLRLITPNHVKLSNTDAISNNLPVPLVSK